jgi:crossover junction endodeoxyribonuclease RuvC
LPKLLGLDPGLGTTGWGVIEANGNRLSHVANGQLRTDAAAPLPERLADLARQLEALIADAAVDGVAVEEVFVNKNPQSTLKLGQARGVILMTAARGGLPVAEYAARLVKKAVVGNGNAEKVQVHAMVSRLLPGAKIAGPDAADALAVAITHAHHVATQSRSTQLGS